uniref:Uncharacterized protein n=1 Tax=Sphaerodactylus townsendi TaxID=933632 RepID=A0ACB8EDM2_9SAUR
MCLSRTAENRRGRKAKETFVQLPKDSHLERAPSPSDPDSDRDVLKEFAVEAEGSSATRCKRLLPHKCQTPGSAQSGISAAATAAEKNKISSCGGPKELTDD